MDGRLIRIEHQLSGLQAAVARLDERLALVECTLRAHGTSVPAVSEADSIETTPHEAATGSGAAWVLRAVTLTGRSLLVFAGAYLLRALTDTGTLPAAAGIGLGLAYAAVWLVASARAHDVLGASFHGATAAFVAFPLLVESTLRFGLITPAASAVALTALTAVFLVTAWRTAQHPLAWIVTVASVTAGIVLAVRGDATGPFAAHLVLLGIATLWLGYDREWTILRWPVAAVANLFVLGLTARALNPDLGQSSWMALGVQLLLLGGYLTSIAIRTIVRGRNVIPFEVVQTVAALGLGLGGAIAVTGSLEMGTAALGAVSCLMGAATYAVAFAWVERRASRATNFLFYTSLALVLTSVGFTVLLDGAALAMTLTLLGAGAATLGSRLSRMTLVSHAAVYLVGAAWASGLVIHATRALVGQTDGPIGWLPASAAMVALAAGACALIEFSGGPSGPARLRDVPRLILIAVFALGLASTGVEALARAARFAGAEPGMGLLATDRTAVLSMLALAAAWTSRWSRVAVGGALVYPILVLTGLRLIAEDLRHSTPSTLFVAFAFYGAGLILAPRLKRAGVR